jgi:hypothetical protein
VLPSIGRQAENDNGSIAATELGGARGTGQTCSDTGAGAAFAPLQRTETTSCRMRDRGAPLQKRGAGAGDCCLGAAARRSDVVRAQIYRDPGSSAALRQDSVPTPLIRHQASPRKSSEEPSAPAFRCPYG